MTKRGDEIPRPQPWIVRTVDRQAAKGWDELAGQVLAAVDRAWVAITSDPRRVDSRQHRLKGRLGTVIVLGQPMEQWQFEVTSGGRIWYAIDDQKRTLWLTHAGTGHPKRTDR